MLIQSDKVVKQEQYFKNFQNGNILRHQWWRHQLKLLSPCNLHVNLIPIIWQKKLSTTFIQGLKVNIEPLVEMSKHYHYHFLQQTENNYV